MKRIVLYFISIFLFINLAGCAESKFTVTGQTFPPYTGPVKVLTELPKDNYIEVGWVSSKGGTIHQWTDLIEAMQKEAASKGANAIVLYNSDNTNSSMVTYNPQFGLMGSSGSHKNLLAIAIRISE